VKSSRLVSTRSRRQTPHRRKSLDSTTQTLANVSHMSQQPNGSLTTTGMIYLCRPLPLRISCFALPTPNFGSSGLSARTMT